MDAHQPDNPPATSPIRLCVVTTVGSSVQVMYTGRLEYLMEHGFDVTVVCASSELDDGIQARGVRLCTIPMARPIRPWTDLTSLWRLWRFFRREKFDLVEVGFPKSSLLGAMAGRLAGAPHIVHVLHGLIYESRGPLMGWLLRTMTKVPCRVADVTFAVSNSVRDAICAAGLCRPERVRVIRQGSCNGVDLERFSPEKRDLGRPTREKHDIPADAIVVGYLGRLAGQKGIAELAAAFQLAAQRRPELVLLLVGDYEPHDPVPAEAVELLATHRQVRRAGWQDDPVPYMAACDLVVLPSYREGLGVVLLEAGALGLPAIATDVTGCRDAVRHEETGLLVPVHDPAALAAAMERLAGDAQLRADLGANACRWVRSTFRQRDVWEFYAEEYRRLVGR